MSPDPDLSSFISEQECLAALREGDECAFEEIYDLYWRKVFSAAYNHLRCQESAKEVVQEVFAGLWMNRQKITVRNTVEGYLMGAARNKVYDAFDRQKVRQKYDQHLLYTFTESVNTTEQTLRFEELATQVTREVECLPAFTQQVFKMSRHEDFSIPEIARHLQVSVKTVEYHLGKALKHLRLRLL